MKYIVGAPHKQINRVYLYSNKSKAHFYGEYRDYLIKKKIDYFNIAVQDNRVYFIPCLIKEYDESNKSIKISHDKKKGTLSFSCKKLIDYFDIIDKKSIEENQKYEAYKLNYIQIFIDKNRKGIYFDIPKEIQNNCGPSESKDVCNCHEAICSDILESQETKKENLLNKLKEIEIMVNNL